MDNRRYETPNFEITEFVYDDIITISNMGGIELPDDFWITP